jgi:hypothetical protein
MLRTVGVLTAVVVVFASEVAAAKTPGSARNSQFKFPNRVGFFVRKGVRADQAGDPIATYWAGSLALATVYYYRTRGQPLEREYSSCKGEVKMVSPSARLISDSTFHSLGTKRKARDLRHSNGTSGRSRTGEIAAHHFSCGRSLPEGKGGVRAYYRHNLAAADR